LTTAVLPVFLLGALSDLIRRDLGIGATAIGATVTVLFLTSGVTAAPIGRLTERLGATTSLRTGIVLAGSATAAIGAVAQRWWHIAALVAVVGMSVSLVDTGAARAFADRIAPSRQGSAFGIKEASVPAASMLAGLALPTLATTLGWRATFVGALAIAVVVLLALPRRSPAPAEDAAQSASGPTAGALPAVTDPATIRFAVGVGLGSGAATAAATFLVPALTAGGTSTTVAGVLLAVASLASIVVRLGVGRWADDLARGPARAVTVMIVIGAGGAIALAFPAGDAVAALAAVTVLGGGWGWTGLAFLAVVRSRPGAPAAAAGMVLTGLGAGGALGPLAFGALAQAASYSAAWALAAE
jgi:predicted MFS family arabinose efflux permease